MTSMISLNKYARNELESLKREEVSLFYSLVLPNRSARKREELIFRFNHDIAKLRERIEDLVGCYWGAIPISNHSWQIQFSEKTYAALKELHARLNEMVGVAESENAQLEKRVKGLLADKQRFVRATSFRYPHIRQ